MKQKHLLVLVGMLVLIIGTYISYNLKKADVQNGPGASADGARSILDEEKDDVTQGSDSLHADNVDVQSEKPDDSSRLVTYRNEDFGLEFQYPSEWGEVSLTVANTLSISTKEDRRPRIGLGRLNESAPQRPKGSLAYLQVDEVCGVYLQAVKLIGTEHFVVVLNKTSGPSSYLPLDECYDMYYTFPDVRKEKRESAHSTRFIVFLEEQEIPESMRSDYQLFKNFLESLTSL